MGAFDGYVRGACSGFSTNPAETYFKNQPAFHFYPGFGEQELRKLLQTAHDVGSDTVWVPNMYCAGHIGLSTWYVKALLENIDARD